jgi:hypothetical protein
MHPAQQAGMHHSATAVDANVQKANDTFHFPSLIPVHMSCLATILAQLGTTLKDRIDHEVT